MAHIQYITEIRPDDVMSVSGGIDSIAACFWLMKFKGIKKVYHFNHKLRQQNDLMEKSVESFCKDFNLELFKEESRENMNSENEFRKHRLDSFFKKYEGNLITAHTLNDAVESYLFNCFRGHSEFLPIPIQTKMNNSDFNIIHPFLLTTKEQFKDIIDKNQLDKYIIEDETNSISSYCQRNWIRHEIVPQLKDRNLHLEKLIKKKYLNYVKKYKRS
jgi:tRNA(Ile)-lysidine synthase TilS/MesJ